MSWRPSVRPSVDDFFRGNKSNFIYCCCVPVTDFDKLRPLNNKKKVKNEKNRQK